MNVGGVGGRGGPARGGRLERASRGAAGRRRGRSFGGLLAVVRDGWAVRAALSLRSFYIAADVPYEGEVLAPPPACRRARRYSVPAEARRVGGCNGRERDVGRGGSCWLTRPLALANFGSSGRGDLGHRAAGAARHVAGTWGRGGCGFHRRAWLAGAARADRAGKSRQGGQEQQERAGRAGKSRRERAGREGKSRHKRAGAGARGTRARHARQRRRSRDARRQSRPAVANCQRLPATASDCQRWQRLPTMPSTLVRDTRLPAAGREPASLRRHPTPSSDPARSAPCPSSRPLADTPCPRRPPVPRCGAWFGCVAWPSHLVEVRRRASGVSRRPRRCHAMQRRESCQIRRLRHGQLTSRLLSGRAGKGAVTKQSCAGTQRGDGGAEP